MFLEHKGCWKFLNRRENVGSSVGVFSVEERSRKISPLLTAVMVDWK